MADKDYEEQPLISKCSTAGEMMARYSLALREELVEADPPTDGDEAA
jgi:hypothetical protein